MFAATAVTSVEDLIALNDELIALVAAGLPLGQGLAVAADELNGRLKTLGHSMAEDLNQGKRLDTVLEQAKSTFPPVYRAVVAAGIESGR